MPKVESLLIIAYFYPPVSGTGIPGVQRIARLIKYSNIDKIYVLTLKQNAYPSYLEIHETGQQRYRNENVVRTSTFEPINWIMRKKKKQYRDKMQSCSQADAQSKFVPIENGYVKKFKSVINGIFDYPDFASGWIVPALFYAIRIVNKNKVDTIIASGVPWSSLVIATICKSLFKELRLIVDFRDPWANNPYNKKNSIFAALDRIMERWVVERADMVMTTTDELRHELGTRYRDWCYKIKTLNNGYDPDDFKDIRIEVPGDRIIITHAGLLYKERDPVDIINALVILRDSNKDIFRRTVFQQIGNFVLTYDLQEKIRNNGLEDNFKIIPQIRHKECLERLAMSSILVIIQPGTRTQIPSKLYEYIYLEKPILSICERNSALSRMTEDHNFGVCIQPGRPDQIAKFIGLYRQGTFYGSKSKYSADKLIPEVLAMLKECGKSS